MPRLLLVLFFGFSITAFAFAETIEKTVAANPTLQKQTVETDDAFVARIIASADNGDAEACILAGDFYRDGKYLEPDYEKAFAFYKKAADLGSASGMFEVAYAYNLGRGVQKNLVKALELYRTAADKGISGAMFNLGFFYANGVIVETNFKTADQWFSQYADKKGLSGKIEIALNYALFRPEPLKSNGVEILKKYAQTANPQAQCAYGNYLYSKEPSRRNEAIDWFKSSAKQNYGLAYRWLGAIFTKDKNFSDHESMKEGIGFFELGAKLGQVDCQSILGSLYYQGVGVKQDYKIAFEWLSKAAEQNDPVALYYLGLLYYNGSYIDKDYKKAAKLFRQSAASEYPLSQLALARLYFQGNGVEQNMPLAFKYMRAAADNGNSEAKEGLLLFQNLESNKR